MFGKHLVDQYARESWDCCGCVLRDLAWAFPSGILLHFYYSKAGINLFSIFLSPTQLHIIYCCVDRGGRTRGWELLCRPASFTHFSLWKCTKLAAAGKNNKGLFGGSWDIRHAMMMYSTIVDLINCFCIKCALLCYKLYATWVCKNNKKCSYSSYLLWASPLWGISWSDKPDMICVSVLWSHIHLWQDSCILCYLWRWRRRRSTA